MQRPICKALKEILVSRISLMWWSKQTALLSRLEWIQAQWGTINPPGRNYALGQSQPNPGPPSPRLAASGNNETGMTEYKSVGKLNEPIISPLLTLTMTLQFPASWKPWSVAWHSSLRDPLLIVLQRLGTPRYISERQTVTILVFLVIFFTWAWEIHFQTICSFCLWFCLH